MKSIPTSPRPGKPTISASSWSATGPHSAPSSRASSTSSRAVSIRSISKAPSKLLKESLTRLGSDAVVEIIPGRDHGSILDHKLAQRLDREMKAAVASFLEKN